VKREGLRAQEVITSKLPVAEKMSEGVRGKGYGLPSCLDLNRVVIYNSRWKRLIGRACADGSDRKEDTMANGELIIAESLCTVYHSREHT